jgi:hypothetical protein
MVSLLHLIHRPQGCVHTGAFALLLGLAGSAAATPMVTASAYGQLPLSFEPNQGQTAPEVRFLSRGPGYQLFLTVEEAVLALQKPAPKAETGKGIPAQPKKAEGAVVRMHLDGANPHAAIAGQSPLPGKVNYLRGNDPKQWRTDIPTYEKVKYTNVYPGIDLVYYGRARQLEYDFIVAPGADPQVIALSFSGGKLQLSDSGDLVLATATGEVRFQKPVLYQEIEGQKQPVEGQYVRRGTDRIGFQVGTYDATRPLVIDPVLSYSTYLGGSDWDWGTDIAVDARGQAYVTGDTRSVDFPTRKALQSAHGRGRDAFVAKLNASGTALVYATYLGGSNDDQSWGIAVDPRGQTYVIGSTESIDFPTTFKALQPEFGGGTQDEFGNVPSDAFIAKLNTAGNALVYSTYLGGSGYDSGTGIVVDARGQAYVVGSTSSADFPTQKALQPDRGDNVPWFGDAFVAKLNVAGSVLVYSTYLGGSGYDAGSSIAVDRRGQVYVTGLTLSDDFPITLNALQPVHGSGDAYNFYSDAFVAKLNAAGSALAYSTYLGGSTYDLGADIAVDPRGQAYVVGYTWSEDFPTHKALQSVHGGNIDAFVAKLNPTGTALDYATYLGGSEADGSNGIVLGPRGQIYVTGFTWSDDFPITFKALQPDHGGSADAFIAQLNAVDSALVYSTYLGGSEFDDARSIAVAPRGEIYITGYTESNDFPLRRALQSAYGGNADAFVVKITSSHLLEAAGKP